MLKKLNTNKSYMKKLWLLLLVVCPSLYGQVVDPQIQKYRDDLKGDVRYRREGVMDGNLVRTLYYNNGEVGQWPYMPSGEWPKGSGHSYLDGVAVLVTTEITAPATGKKEHPLETSYREWMDKDLKTGTIWGLEPVPGYFNESSENMALNTNKNSWPATWPSALGLSSEWNGYWYGYFGRGVNNSDFETFFVMDDSKDGEWQQPAYKYYPLASDSSRGGLGLRVEVRGFQWSHVLAEDIIFWHYDIVNISDNPYPNTYFGFYTDCGVGGKDDSEDDNASFDKKIDLAYCYDSNGKGVPNDWKTGYYGYAYLESPGNSTNGMDDDEDGIVDEKRDDGIDNDKDWKSYVDINGNGKWDSKLNEPLNDDVGEDGVGPFDPQYLGPDPGEGDGIPTAGEPNFDKTDKDESDQIGLTSVSIYRLGQGGTGGGWPKDDEAMWQRMSSTKFDTSLQKSNISMVFASGSFPLNEGKRERFSMALLFGDNLDDIKFNKETVQQIYNANYNFSKPPYKPTLTAVPGDGKVFLYWDSIAEESRDPFLGFEGGDMTKGYKKDFEGYLVYRSTEAEFNDIKTITDSKGAAKYWKPIAQFDKIDKITGPDPVGINGASFWRGDDRGLSHSYVDTDVKNGQRYYYALVSYDMGDPSYGTKGLQPSECTKIISEDYAGNVQFVDINCAVITPNAPVAGYKAPEITGDLNSAQGIGTGGLNVFVLNPDAIKAGASYKIQFTSAGDVPKYKTTSYSILRILNGVTDTLQAALDTSFIGVDKYSPPFDGLTMSVKNDTAIAVIDTATGWLSSKSNLGIHVLPETSSRGISWPSDYEIQFTDAPADTSFIEAAAQGYKKFPVNFTITNKTTGKRSKFATKDYDLSGSLTIGDEIQILEFVGSQSVSNSRIAWRVLYSAPDDPLANPVMPAGGDKYEIKTSKQFKTGDYFTFTPKAMSVDNSMAKTELSKISVVPNPYLGAASWERRTLNTNDRGERKIDIINLPAKCTVRIYNMAGSLVKTLEKDSSPSDGSISWNLVSEDGMEIAYGVYFYHVDAPGIGTYIGKFAVIK
ncbi:MAG: hypothetical protein ACM3SM_02100 [Bacteroidota bacterium]